MDDARTGWRERLRAYLLAQAKDPGTIRSIAVCLAFSLGYTNAQTAQAEIISLLGIGLAAISAALPPGSMKR